jgi:hypothetical protein
LNATGLAILEGLRDGQTHEEITASLVETFDVTAADASRDVDDFMDHLRTFRLL